MEKKEKKYKCIELSVPKGYDREKVMKCLDDEVPSFTSIKNRSDRIDFLFMISRIMKAVYDLEGNSRGYKMNIYVDNFQWKLKSDEYSGDCVLYFYGDKSRQSLDCDYSTKEKFVPQK